MRTRLTAFALVLCSLLLVIGGSPTAAGITSDVDLVENGGFDPIELRDLDPWVVVNGTKDKVVCGPKAPPNTDGGCAFRFKGSSNESAKLKQTADSNILDEANALLAAQTGQISLNFDYYSEIAASSLKSKLVIFYTPDGGTSTKGKMTDTAGARPRVGNVTSSGPPKARRKHSSSRRTRRSAR